MLRKFDIGASLELDHSQSLSYFVKSTVTIKEPSLKKETKYILSLHSSFTHFHDFSCSVNLARLNKQKLEMVGNQLTTVRAPKVEYHINLINPTIFVNFTESQKYPPHCFFYSISSTFSSSIFIHSIPSILLKHIHYSFYIAQNESTIKIAIGDCLMTGINEIPF